MAAAETAAAADAGAVVATDAQTQDRVGLGWRPELAAGIHLHLSHINVLEVLADNFFVAPRRTIAALRALGREVPLSLHGVGMGLASTIGVEMARVERMARLAAALEPESWSEHLAFVRAGGTEIGHLAAPPAHGDHRGRRARQYRVCRARRRGPAGVGEYSDAC